jgi:hypothetical protein
MTPDNLDSLSLDRLHLIRSDRANGMPWADISAKYGHTRMSILCEASRRRIGFPRPCIARGVTLDSLDIRTRIWEQRISPKLRPSGTCLEWHGAATTKGYGTVRCNLDGRSKNFLTHRTALEVSLGRVIEDGMMALHTCDNPRCCNPEHLYVGSSADNTRDALARGRRWLSTLQTGQENRRHPATGRYMPVSYATDTVPRFIFEESETRIAELERENAKLREALTTIVRGGYADGADVAHPAIGIAAKTLTTLRCLTSPSSPTNTPR